MTLFFKYMASLRCIILVKEELEKTGLHYKTVHIGEAEIEEDISAAQWHELDIALKKSGIELIGDKKSVLIGKIKSAVIELVHYSEEPLNIKFSTYLSQKLNHSYTDLANLFSESQGITLMHFYVMHKIERVKELLVYDQLNITAIAWKLGYNSASHLSKQFKNITGLTPSFFKSLKIKKIQIVQDA
jgi:AraC-like DNA-binding protein